MPDNSRKRRAAESGSARSFNDIPGRVRKLEDYRYTQKLISGTRIVGKCMQCGSVFWRTRPKRFCDRKCRDKYNRRHRKDNPNG